jgi:3-methyladenine DNA glycosylase AlkC
MSGATQTVASVQADHERLSALQSGQVESRTLTECLAVDFSLLARCLDGLGEADVAQIKGWAKQGITRRMQAMGDLLRTRLGEQAAEALAVHPSDTVRGWAAYMIAGRAAGALSDRLQAMRSLADDPHFGVREWAWLALRPHLAADLPQAIQLLTPWTGEGSDYLRRFASEATRPRGVWCSHLPLLKAQPGLALPILEPLRADPSPYVQDSVANWLNDAAKSQPDWVRDLCAQWSAAEDSPATERICKRAQRSL